MSTIEKLQHVMRSVFFDDTLTIAPHMSALDVDGWDSLSHSMLVLDIEQAFGIDLDVGKVAACRNVGELVQYIDSLTPRQ